MKQTFEAFDATRNLEDKPFKSLCYAPDVQMSFSPNGDVSACCISRSHVLGNVRTESLDEIWHGERLRQFRDMLRRYVFPPGCETCRWSLHAGNYTDNAIRPFDLLPLSEDSPWPVKLEFALNNTCNLGCIMCNGEYSSVLRVKEGLPPIPAAYGDRFFSDLADYLPHAKWLSFLGGEPFLQNECRRIWDMLIELGLPTPCHVTTNGSIYNNQVERFLQNLPFNFNISVDGVTKETVESIRVNVKFDKLMENIRRFNAYAQGDSDPHASKRIRHLQLNYCVMQQNWRELADFFLYAEDLGAVVWTVLVTYPEYCTLFSLPKDELRVIVNELDRQTATIEGQLQRNRDNWIALIGELHQHLEEKVPPTQAIVQIAPRTRASAPDDVASHMHQAWQFMKDGKDEEALRAAQKTPPADPLYYKALLLVAEIKTNRGEFSAAEAALDEAVALTAKHPESYLRRAWLRYHQGRLEDGLEQLDLAEQAMSRLGRVEAFMTNQLLLTRGTLLYHQGEMRQAIDELDRYLELRPDDEDARNLRSGAELQLSH